MSLAGGPNQREIVTPGYICEPCLFGQNPAHGPLYATKLTGLGGMFQSELHPYTTPETPKVQSN